MSETSEEKFSMFDNFLHFLRIFVFGPFFADQVTAMPQFDMQNMLLLFSFFYAVIMIRTPYFICIIFVKTYNYILANINSESPRVIFSFFCLQPMGQTFLYPSKFYNHLKHSAK